MNIFTSAGPGETPRMSLSIKTALKINKQYYASLGEKIAFVMSHGRKHDDLKIVDMPRMLSVTIN